MLFVAVARRDMADSASHLKTVTDSLNLWVTLTLKCNYLLYSIVKIHIFA